MDSQTSKTIDKNKLERKKHIDKLIKFFTEPLGARYQHYVPSQAWTVYWGAHSLALLDKMDFLDTVANDVIDFMLECKHKDGGYGGGPGQLGHLGTTFAAVNALATLTNDKALESIDRVGILRFLHDMKQIDGSFTLHKDGEIDSRASYCALAVIRLLNITDDLLIENVADWLLSCQTYEGGFGSLPGAEAHGGYTFCCVAGLRLLNQLHRVNMDNLLRWLTAKQLTPEEGFCGRSNKLVDSCYSYWQGGIFPLIHHILSNVNPMSPDLNQTTDNKPRTRSQSKDANPDYWLFNAACLQNYILNHCQADDGLLRDKPSAEPDIYHTCYALSGLSISQHQPSGITFDIGDRAINVIGQTNALMNLTPQSLQHCVNYFENRSIGVEKINKR